MNLLGITSPEDEAEAMRRRLLKAGVTDEDFVAAKEKPQALVDDRTTSEAVGSLLAPAMPQTPWEQAEEEYGTGEAILRRLGNLFTGGLFDEQIIPELSTAGRAKHASDLKAYNAYETKMMEQQVADRAAQARRDRLSALGGNLRDAWATEGYEDDIEAVWEARVGGMDLADIKYAQQMAGHTFQDPAWETKFDNGILVRYDKNGVAPTQPVLNDSGSPITEKMDGDMRKTSGWFKRAVPALENMHKLEDRGVTLSREVLTLMQQAQDADGIFQPQIYNKLINDLNLSKDQKQYLRNAQDLAMIQLRKESGAAIGVQEMYNELSQNVMLDDMSDEGYEYQRGSRGRKYRALSEGMPSYLIDEYKDEGYFDTLDTLRKGSARRDPSVWDGERTDFSNFKNEDFEKILDSLPPGEYIAPNGKTIIWDGPKQLGSSVFGRKK